MYKKTLITLILTLLIISACAPAVSSPDVMVEEPTEAMMEKPTDEMADEMMDDEPPDAAMEEPTAAPESMSGEMMDSPAWFSVQLTDVRTGEDFTIKDFNGKVVLVENLAMWCSNCKRQQGEVKSLHAALGMETDLVSIGLDIDTNENAEDLKVYTESNGFDWIYAVAPAEVTREIANLYGAQFLNPPSTPILIIDREGEVHPMPFGIKSADDLREFIEPFLSEGM